MLPGLAGGTVTRVRSIGGEDNHGNLVPVGLTSIDIPGCSIQPGGTSEDLLNRDATMNTFNVFMPLTADVVAGDRIIWAGLGYRVVGQPERWQTGFLDYQLVRIQVWDG